MPVFQAGNHGRRLLAGLVLLLAPVFAAAVPVKWTLNNVAFDDGGTASGYFIYDVDVGQFGTVTEIKINVGGGNSTAFPAVAYDQTTATGSAANSNGKFYVNFMQNGASHRQLRFQASPSFLNTGGTGTIETGLQSNSVECFDCAPYRLVTHGTLEGVPVSPLFQITPAMSGNWYNPSQDGHGFQIEVLPGGVVTAFWFVFDNVGNQVWLNGVGTIDHDRVVMDTSHFHGGHFPPAFNSNDLVPIYFGKLTLIFSDCNTGLAKWSASEQGYTSGELAIKRLTRIAGMTCP